MLDTVQILRKFMRKPERREESRSRLGFALLSPENGNIIEETGHNPRRLISRSGNGYLYSLSGSITANDMRCMETAKARFLSYVCSLQPSSLPSIKDAQPIIKSKLIDLASPDRADLLSYLVAHDTAGYGPISILLEDRHNIEESGKGV